QSASYRWPAEPATMVRMQIQPWNFLPGCQHGSQLQLCVPQVALKGDSYRLKDRDLGRVPAAGTTED
ncbi:MAG: hypothetical protein ACRDPY_01125, partial [Streptosporangiaceae bacterium]